MGTKNIGTVEQKKKKASAKEQIEYKHRINYRNHAKEQIKTNAKQKYRDRGTKKEQD
jgi:hypothetical protein